MTDISQLQGLGDVLAYPVQAGPEYQRRLAEWGEMQALLRHLSQPPPGSAPGTAPFVTEEEMKAWNPKPVEPGITSVLQTPVLGTALKGLGTLGQVLQIVSGSRTGVPAPRPPTALLSLRRSEALDAWRQQQAKSTQDWREKVHADTERHRAFIEAHRGGGDEKPAKSVADELLRTGRAKGLSGQALADFVEQGSKAGPERDLDILAQQKFPGDPQKQAQWREEERIRLAAGKSGATSEGRTAGQQLTAITSARSTLSRNRQAIAALLASTPPELLTQPASLWLQRMQGNPAAIDAGLAVLAAPELAKSMGLTSRFNQVEFNMYAGVLDPSKMTAKQYLATMDRLSQTLDDEERRLRAEFSAGPSSGAAGGGGGGTMNTITLPSGKQITVEP